MVALRSHKLCPSAIERKSERTCRARHDSAVTIRLNRLSAGEILALVLGIHLKTNDGTEGNIDLRDLPTV
eukprot:940374-Prymnesium_polylepis.1